MYSNNSEYDAFYIEKNRAINLWHNDILCLNGTLSGKYDSHDEPNSKVSSSDLHGSFYNIGVGMAEDILSIDYEQEKISSSFNDLRINKKISTFRKNESSLSKYNFLEENSFEKSNSTNENYLIDRLPCSKKSYNNDSLEKQSSEFSINYSSITDPNSLHDANSCACEFSFNPLYNKSIISNLFDSDYSDSIIPKNQVTPKQQCQSKVIESIKTRNYLDEDDDFKPNHNSNFLEEFKNSSVLQNTLQLRDLVGHMAEFSKDQHGSRLIQHRLEKASQFEKSLLLNEMVASNISISLVTDAFGNYVVQKMIEHGSMDQRKRLVKEFQGRVLSLSLQMYGCRVIQKSLEYLSEDVQISVISELDGHVIRCVKDQNGNHVIQKCIECINPIHLNKIVDSFKTQVFSLSVHPYGCRVIQRILEYCNKEQKIIILNELQQSANYLVKDQYGNYVIQHVIEHGSQEHRLSLIDVLCDETYDLSQHKFASNVIEKCIVFASKTQRARIIDKICLNNEAILVMTKDQFANYVVQKMLDLCEVNQRKKMLSILKPNLSTLRKYTYGKHIVAKVEKWMSLPKTNNGLDNRKENRNSLYVDIPFKNKSKSK